MRSKNLVRLRNLVIFEVYGEKFLAKKSIFQDCLIKRGRAGKAILKNWTKTVERTVPPQMRQFLVHFNRELEQQATGRSKNQVLVKSGATKAFKRSELPGRMLKRVPENGGEDAIIEVVPDTQSTRLMLLENGGFNAM